MGLLDFIFGDKQDITKKLFIDKNKRLSLWNMHLVDFTKREELSKHFNSKNVDQAIENWEDTLKVLKQIGSLVSSDLINIHDEEKLEKEIAKLLKKLRSFGKIEQLTDTLVHEKRKQATILAVFQEIHDTLKTELLLLKIIEQKPANVKDLLLQLFRLIFFHEAMLYKPFIQENYRTEKNKPVHAEITKLATMVLLQKKLKEEIETDEEKFVKQMVKQMGDEEPKRRHRALAEGIYWELSVLAGAPMPSSNDLTKGIQKMEKLMTNDALMYKIVKKLRPRYDNTKIRTVIIAFRKTYDLGHFLELEAWFAT